LQASARLLGQEHPDTLRAMLNLAGTLRAQGDLPGARKLQEQVLEARRRLLGKEHPVTLLAMNNLAGTLYTQRGSGHGAQAPGTGAGGQCSVWSRECRHPHGDAQPGQDAESPKGIWPRRASSRNRCCRLALGSRVKTPSRRCSTCMGWPTWLGRYTPKGICPGRAS
jgi:hypothetical protein